MTSGNQPRSKRTANVTRSFDADFAAYDRLPRRLRDVLKDFAFNFDSVAVRELASRCPVGVVERTLREQELRAIVKLRGMEYLSSMVTVLRYHSATNASRSVRRAIATRRLPTWLEVPTTS